MKEYLISLDSGVFRTVPILVFFLISCFGAGRSFILLSGLDEADRRRRAFVSIALGININGIILYASSFTGAINYWLSYLMLGVGCVFGLCFIVREKYYALPRPSLNTLLWAGLLVFASAPALSYPTGWDELVYHISVPLRWADVNFPAVFTDNPYSAFPSMAEMTFWKLIWAGGIKMPRLLCFLVTVLSVYGFYLLIKPGLSKSKASLIVFSMAVSPVMLMLWREAYVESFIILNSLAALTILMHGKGRTVGTVALLVGGCAALKLTGLAAGFVIFLAWTLIFLRRRPWSLKKFLKSAALFGIISGLTAFIFYLRPFIMTGNPCYPYFASYFGGNEAARLTSDFHYLSGSMKYGITGITGFFTIPLTAALASDAFDGSFGFQGVLLWISLIFSVFLIFRKRDCFSNKTLLLVVPAFLTYIFWFFSSQQMRFLAVLPFLCALDLKYNLRILPGRKLKLTLILGLTALALISIPTGAIRHFINCWKPSTPENFVYSSTGEGYLQSIDAVRQFIVKDSKYLILFERRGLYYPGNYEMGTPFFQEKYFSPPPSSSREMMKILRKNKLDYILIGQPRKHPDRLPGFEEKLITLYYFIKEASDRKELEKIWSHDGYALYRIPLKN
ncbi:MAG: hypothetical protein A2020_00020 [Lentisphaerae bacterium GWF2_45_14]|nr:MAG: hypothetical protein A2020_00020 [Lentisphaerae bacterium GWF2_45_14]